MLLVFALLAIGILARFMPHAPNFTPVLALALFGSAYLKRSYALTMPLALMMISDLYLGLHPVIAFTWGSVLLVSCIGLWLRTSPRPGRVLAAGLISAVLFFLITNFGVWLAYYPHTREGLALCYALAVPFFRTMLVSTLLYTLVMFGTYELLVRYIRKTRFAPVLLS